MVVAKNSLGQEISIGSVIAYPRSTNGSMSYEMTPGVVMDSKEKPGLRGRKPFVTLQVQRTNGKMVYLTGLHKLVVIDINTLDINRFPMTVLKEAVAEATR